MPRAYTFHPPGPGNQLKHGGVYYRAGEVVELSQAVYDRLDEATQTQLVPVDLPPDHGAPKAKPRPKARKKVSRSKARPKK